MTGNESDLQAFVGDRNQSFVNAVLNFLYAYYRDMYRVKEIHLLEKVEEKDGVLDSDGAVSCPGAERGIHGFPVQL